MSGMKRRKKTDKNNIRSNEWYHKSLFFPSFIASVISSKQYGCMCLCVLCCKRFQIWTNNCALKNFIRIIWNRHESVSLLCMNRCKYKSRDSFGRDFMFANGNSNKKTLSIWTRQNAKTKSQRKKRHVVDQSLEWKIMTVIWSFCFWRIFFSVAQK